MKKIHDHVHRYRGYRSEGDRCRMRAYREDGHAPVVVCSQASGHDNPSVTNTAQYLTAEVIEEHRLCTPLIRIEDYSEYEGEMDEHTLVRFSDWELGEVRLGVFGAIEWYQYAGIPRPAEADWRCVLAAEVVRSLYSETPDLHTLWVFEAAARVARIPDECVRRRLSRLKLALGAVRRFRGLAETGQSIFYRLREEAEDGPGEASGRRRRLSGKPGLTGRG